MPVKPIPDGYHTATPYLIVHDAASSHRLLPCEFRRERVDAVGGAGRQSRTRRNTDRRLADHARRRVPGNGAHSPQSIGGSPVSILLYLDNVDAQFAQAVAAGAKLRPVQDQFYGDRSGTLQDPFGHQWTLATHVEDVPPDEINRRFEAMQSP